MTPMKKSIVKALKDGPVHIDNIARNCDLGINTTGSILVMLEMKGFVDSSQGRHTSW